MKPKHLYILFLILFFTTTVFGQEKHKLKEPVSVELVWKPIIGIPKKLQVEINKSDIIKKIVPNDFQPNFEKKLLKLTPDTLYFKDLKKVKKGKYNTIRKPFLPSRLLKASPLIFKDNAKKNIVYQDLSHGFFTNSTRSLEQDKEGYIWIGSSKDGLCKYDGFKYEIFTKKSNLPSNSIKDLQYDLKEILWVATDVGLSYIKDNELFLINIPGIDSPNITELTIDRNNAIWFGTENQGLIKIENGNFTIYDKSNVLPTNTTYGMFHDKKGNYWVGLSDQHGFVRFDDEKIVHYNIKNGHALAILSDFYEDDQGIWIGLFQGGLVQFKNDSFWRYDFFNPGYDNIYSINKNKKGLWFNIYGRGIVSFNGTEVNYFGPQDGLPSRHTFEAFIDDKNNIWGTDLSKGIGRINENIFSVSDDIYKSTPNIVLDKEKNKWFCTNGSTLKKETKEGEIVEYYNKISNEVPTASYIWDVVFNDKGEAWGATYGLGCLNFTENEFIFYNFPKLGQLGNILYAVETDNNRNVWFTSRENGLIKYDGTDFYQIKKTNGLTSNKTNKIFKDTKGKLWVGTDNNGVNIIKENCIATIDQLASSSITSFYEDKKGSIWIGTSTDGIYLLKEDKLFNIKQENGLISNDIRSFIQDNHGKYWIATAKGISSLSFNDDFSYKVRNFGVEFGTFLTGFSSAVHLNDDGSILWGAADNIVKYNPKNERTGLTGPKLILKNYSTKTKGVKTLDPKHKIPISPEDELVIFYTALDWGYEDKVHFEYTLVKRKDSIKEWTNLHRDTELKLKNIPTGKYNLFIKAVGANGITISPKIEVRFRPFWWETIWFKIAVILFMLLGFYLFYKWRTNSLLKRQTKLEDAVTKKTALIEQEKKRLKIRNNIIEGQKTEIGMLLEEVNHRVKNNLTMLTSLFYFQEKQIKNPEAKRALQDGINRIKAISIIHEKLHEYDNHTKISFKEYIQDLIQSIESSVAPRDKTIKTEVKCEDVTMEVSKSVYLALIINELITNSYKYAFNHVKEGSIVVSLKAVLNEKFELKIYDNGNGLKHDWENNIHNSTGLNLVKMLAQQIDAEMTYNHNNFSTFTFIF